MDRYYEFKGSFAVVFTAVKNGLQIHTADSRKVLILDRRQITELVSCLEESDGWDVFSRHISLEYTGRMVLINKKLFIPCDMIEVVKQRLKET